MHICYYITEQLGGDYLTDDSEARFFKISKRLFLLEQKQDFQRLSMEVQSINFIFLSWENLLTFNEDDKEKKDEFYKLHFGFFELANEYNKLIEEYEEENDQDKCKELESSIKASKETLLLHFGQFFKSFEYFQIKMIDHVGKNK